MSMGNESPGSLSVIRKFQSTIGGTGVGHQIDSHSSPEAFMSGMFTDDESAVCTVNTRKETTVCQWQ